MVIMECRGTDDSATTPLSLQLTPDTCWTQNPSERTESSNNSSDPFPAYRLDRYATPDARAAHDVAAAASSCLLPAVQHTTPFVGADGTSYPIIGPEASGGCGDVTPAEMTRNTTLDRPGNTTYGVTGADGSGSTLFDMWTLDDNASLGCSDTVPCSLVAIPIMGISCDPAAAGLPAEDQPGDDLAQATANCEATGREPGQMNSQGLGNVDLSVTGALWWSASNWRNKIVVPLQFAPPASTCDLLSTKATAAIYGSELMTQAVGQWAPSLCGADSSYRLSHVQTEEPEARNLLNTNNVEAAFTSNGLDGGYSSPVANAPTAVTGFSVVYTIDDGSGKPVENLKMNARLLAKLLTESYPVSGDVRSEDPDLASNPINIIRDPEFQALNPGLAGPGKTPKYDTGDSPAAAALLVLSSDSDVTWALTNYIVSDPEAREWLDGIPDPWGMKVNPAYRIDFPEAQLSLPTYNWPLLDQSKPASLYSPDINHCLSDDPEPYLPLVASPVSRIATISQDLELSLESATLQCSQPIIGSSLGEKLVSSGRQQPGAEFMIGVTALGDAERYLLPSASLQSQSTVAFASKFTDASGRTFVGPTGDSLKAAADLAVPDETSGVWSIPYATLNSTSVGLNAYPGTMILSTAVPTSGLSTTDASNYASFLRFVGGAGQTPGTANGDLAEGYLPMTAANGLGALVDYTGVVAADVATQSGRVPPLIPGATAAAPSVSATDSQGASVMASAASSPAHSTNSKAPAALPVAPISVPTVASAAPPAAVAPPVLPIPSKTAAKTGVTTTTPAAPLVASAVGPMAKASVTVGSSVGIAGAVLPLLALVALVGLGALGVSYLPLQKRGRR